MLGTDPGPPEERPVILTAAPSLHLLALSFLIVWLVGNCFLSVLDSSRVCRNTVLLLTGLLWNTGVDVCMYYLGSVVESVLISAGGCVSEEFPTFPGSVEIVFNTHKGTSCFHCFPGSYRGAMLTTRPSGGVSGME